MKMNTNKTSEPMENLEALSPLVSVVVAVFNRQDTLDRCIDSLIYQTYQNLQLIFVDDQSDDSSIPIIKSWQKIYPDKIFLYENDTKGVANAKNLGITKATGDYIMFVDSDDYIDYKLVERLVGATSNENVEIVASPIWRITETKKTKIGMFPAKEKETGMYNIRKILTSNDWYLHGRLFKKELFEKYGLLPVLLQGEDLVWLYKVFSYIKPENLAFVHYTGYFYEISENSVTKRTDSIIYAREIIKGNDLILENVNPVYTEQALIYIFRRTSNMVGARPIFSQLFNQYLKDMVPKLFLIPSFEKKYPQTYQKSLELCRKISEAITEKIPLRVYLNGFKGARNNYNLSNILYEEHSTIFLDESNCDINENPYIKEAYELGKMDFVAKYFGIKKCYEEGGIYINDDISVDNPLDMLTENEAFFGFETEKSFSDRVFGCIQGNECVKQILLTYSCPTLYQDKFTELSKRIKTVLIGYGNVYLSSHRKKYESRHFSVYPVESFVYSNECSKDPLYCHYIELEKDEPDTLNEIIKSSVENRQTRIERDSLNKALSSQKKAYLQQVELVKQKTQAISNLENQNRVLLKEYNQVINSKSWKMTNILRKIYFRFFARTE